MTRSRFVLCRGGAGESQEHRKAFFAIRTVSTICTVPHRTICAVPHRTICTVPHRTALSVSYRTVPSVPYSTVPSVPYHPYRTAPYHPYRTLPYHPYRTAPYHPYRIVPSVSYALPAHLSDKANVAVVLGRHEHHDETLHELNLGQRAYAQVEQDAEQHRHRDEVQHGRHQDRHA